VRRRTRALRLLGHLLAWAVVAVPAWAMLFSHSSTDMVVASHDAVVSPSYDGRVRLDMGPYLPDVRSPSSGWIGVDIHVGKTTANTAPELAIRYAAIAAHPDAEIHRVNSAVVGLARDAAFRATGIGLLPIGLWLVLGRRRRKELWRRLRRPDWRGELRTGATALGLAGIVVTLVVQPWRSEPEHVQGDVWLDVVDAFPEVSVPLELSGWQVQGGLITEGTRRLVFSLFDTYRTSKVFYREVTARVEDVADQLHRPKEDETVAVEVSDRHDNIGMDEVVRAAADAAGATVVLDAGDDTSTGQTWEAFSLDSLDNAFDGYDAQVAISGNHDNGTFVSRYLEKQGWTHLDGKAVEPFAGVRVTGVDDPRSSGLGNWRDEKGLTFDEVKDRIADDVCQLDEGDCARAWVHRPGARGSPPRPEGSDPGGRHQRQGGLQLHQRHDWRCGVLHRDREQAAPRRGVHLRHLQRRSSRRHPAGHRPDHRPHLRCRLRPAGSRPVLGLPCPPTPGRHLRLRLVAG